MDAHLAGSLRRVSPTAIGLIPPSFFLRANKLALAKAGATIGGTSPARVMFTNDVRAMSALFPASFAALEMQSLRCWGRRPEGPPADPGAKLPIASLTISTDICRGSASTVAAGHGLRSNGALGCLDFSFFKEFRLGGSISSADEAMRTAPRISPSFIFDDIKSDLVEDFFFLVTFLLLEELR